MKFGSKRKKWRKIIGLNLLIGQVCLPLAGCAGPTPTPLPKVSNADVAGGAQKVGDCGKLVEKAAALDPKNVEAREYLSSWYETAPGLMGGSRDKAVAVAREIVAIDRYQGRMLLGGLAERTPDLAQAEIEYGDAARISPDSGRAFEAWVAMLEGQKKYAEAFRAADARVARLSDDIYGWYHIGRVAGLSGQRIDDGIAAMRRSMQFPLPKTFRYGPGGRHYWLGVLMEHKGSLNEAAAQLDSSLKLNPKDQQAMDALERVNARRKPPD